MLPPFSKYYPQDYTCNHSGVNPLLIQQYMFCQGLEVGLSSKLAADSVQVFSAKDCWQFGSLLT